jgi:wobble nucleotide-excising tRNase
MLKSIKMRDVATFPDSDLLISLSKRVALFYGHNGSGKSTIARALKKQEVEFSKCSITDDGAGPYQILVYNTDYIDQTFYGDGAFPGIFTLGEENKEANEAIDDARKLINEHATRKVTVTTMRQSHVSQKNSDYNAVKNAVWSIKETYEDGGLDFCLDGLKGAKDRLWNKLIASPKASQTADLAALASRAAEINSATGIKKTSLPKISNFTIFNEHLLAQRIVGADDSYLSTLIEKLGNSDWVRDGQAFLPFSENVCPFCQQELKSEFEENLKNLFDERYQESVRQLEDLQTSYVGSVKGYRQILSGAEFSDEYVQGDAAFIKAKAALDKVLDSNQILIDKKRNSPGEIVELNKTEDFVAEVNQCIDAIQIKIDQYNNLIVNKPAALSQIKEQFWSTMRANYDSVIEDYDAKTKAIDGKIGELDKELSDIAGKVAILEKSIEDNQGKITNIDLSVAAINRSLKSIGVNDFKLVKSTEKSGFYELKRGDGNASPYKSLSEGEKTLIALLYFLELCNGAHDQTTSVDKARRIIVLDDPISSLSHNYLYEVSSLICQRLIEPKEFRQILVLTHSMFFFHELYKNFCHKPSKDYEFFRVVKDSVSKVSSMSFEDIKNDYQSYWSLLKDVKEGRVLPVILPNIMRNILEYYFSFVHKKDKLLESLEKLESDDEAFKPFYRYMARGSHSDATNLSDFGALDSSKFLEKFKDVFVRTGFGEHYDAMMF